MKGFSSNFFTFSYIYFFFAQERDPNKATLAKVIPTPNNGFAELVALQRDQVSLHNVSLNVSTIFLKCPFGLGICWGNGLQLHLVFSLFLPAG